MLSYKGHTIELSSTTTDAFINVFGKMKRVIKCVYKIDGKLTCCTSVKSAKDLINS